MFYIALAFWMMVGLLEAYGIFKLWEGVVRPRWINLVLLPGTVVAETAHFLAALLTGAPVRDAKLVSDEPVGQPAAESEKGIPVLGPLLLALLPILAGMVVIYLLYRNFDRSVVAAFMFHGWPDWANVSQLPQKLDWRLVGWFAIAHEMLGLVQRLIDSLPFRDLDETWRSWLFIYLTGCLAIRMVPLRGNLRGGMAAILLVGLLAGGLGKLLPAVDRSLHDAWPLLAYVIALLTLLLLAALLIRGAIALICVLADKQAK